MGKKLMCVQIGYSGFMLLPEKDAIMMAGILCRNPIYKQDYSSKAATYQYTEDDKATTEVKYIDDSMIVRGIKELAAAAIGDESLAPAPLSE